MQRRAPSHSPPRPHLQWTTNDRGACFQKDALPLAAIKITNWGMYAKNGSMSGTPYASPGECLALLVARMPVGNGTPRSALTPALVFRTPPLRLQSMGATTPCETW